MNITVTRRGKPKGAKTRFFGILRIAAKLKVTPEHLRLVLNGKRESEPLVQRYNALIMKPKITRRTSR